MRPATCAVMTLTALALGLGCGGSPGARSRHPHHGPYGLSTAGDGEDDGDDDAADPNAPPPPKLAEAVAAGTHIRIATSRGPVHVWMPAGYKRRTAQTIIYVHGYFTDVDGAWTKYHLPEQFAMSGINAMFIACEAPSVYESPVVWSSLSELLSTVEVETGLRRPRGRVVAIGHSAAFRTLTTWLDDPILDTLILFDAAYEIDQFVSWIQGGPDRRLIDVGDDTRPWTERLHRALPDTV